MGGGTSSSSSFSSVLSVGKTEMELINLMMPVFYTELPLTESDVVLAKASWRMITDDTAPGFLALKGTPGFDYPCCVFYFFDVFYNRLFDVHPMCRPMFKSGLKTQGKFLVKMISMAVGMINEPAKFQQTLIKLTETHNERGVKAIEYGIVVEVLFYALRRCLGEAYDRTIHNIWVRVVSRMLKVMVPVAVAYEIHTGGVHQQVRISECSRISAGFSSVVISTGDDEMEKKYGPH